MSACPPSISCSLPPPTVNLSASEGWPVDNEDEDDCPSPPSSPNALAFSPFSSGDDVDSGPDTTLNSPDPALLAVSAHQHGKERAASSAPICQLLITASTQRLYKTSNDLILEMPALSRVPSLARAPSPTLAGLGFDILSQFEPTSHEALVPTAIVYSSASISSYGEESERSPTISPFLFRRARRAFPFPEDEDSSSSSGDEQKLSPGPSAVKTRPLARRHSTDASATSEPFERTFAHGFERGVRISADAARRKVRLQAMVKEDHRDKAYPYTSPRPDYRAEAMMDGEEAEAEEVSFPNHSGSETSLRSGFSDEEDPDGENSQYEEDSEDGSGSDGLELAGGDDDFEEESDSKSEDL